MIYVCIKCKEQFNYTGSACNMKCPHCGSTSCMSQTGYNKSQITLRTIK